MGGVGGGGGRMWLHLHVSINFFPNIESYSSFSNASLLTLSHPEALY